MAAPISIWEKVSAIATAGAAIIALALPFVMQWLDRRKRNREFESAVKEILRAVEDALVAYEVAYAVARNWSDDNSEARTERITTIEERSNRAAQVLKHLMDRRDLTDAVVRCAVDGRALAEETAKAVSGTHDTMLTPRLDALTALQLHHVRADRTLDQVLRLRQKYKLPVGERLKALAKYWRSGEIIDPNIDFNDDD